MQCPIPGSSRNVNFRSTRDGEHPVSATVGRRQSLFVSRCLSVVRRQSFVVSRWSSSPRVSHCHPEAFGPEGPMHSSAECKAPAFNDHQKAESRAPKANLQSTSSSFPVVFRASRSRCACCASFSGYRCSIRSFSFHAAIMPNTAPARF